MTIGKKLAVSAIMGILGGAAVFAAARHDANAAESPTPSEKAGCSNHDGGKCGAMNTPGRAGETSRPAVS